MKVFTNVLVAILAFLALSSGATKIMLMQSDVDFFGAYGFTSPILIAFGVAHVIGGILLIIPKTRIIGAAVVGLAFAISAVVLILAADVPVAIVTLVAILGLGFVMTQSTKKEENPAT